MYAKCKLEKHSDSADFRQAYYPIIVKKQDSFRIIPKIESLVVFAIPDIPWKFQKNPSITFWVILLTHRQTNSGKNITSLAEVKTYNIKSILSQRNSKACKAVPIFVCLAISLHCQTRSIVQWACLCTSKSWYSTTHHINRWRDGQAEFAWVLIRKATKLCQTDYMVPATVQKSFSLTFQDKMNHFPWLICSRGKYQCRFSIACNHTRNKGGGTNLKVEVQIIC